MTSEAMIEFRKEISRRGFLSHLIGGAGLMMGAGSVAPVAEGAIRKRRPDTATALKVYSAIGNLVIPVDQDPGWATFDPGISEYGMNIYVKQIFLAGNQLAFDGFQDTLVDLNEVPVRLGFETRFLTMNPNAQNKYLTDIVTANFEQDGYQDILNLGANAAIVSAKTTFFSNYPRHLATPGAEFQVLAPSTVKTGWDLMRLKGPVGPDEERRLRERFFDSEEVPGVDTRNPWI